MHDVPVAFIPRYMMVPPRLGVKCASAAPAYKDAQEFRTSAVPHSAREFD